MPPNSAHAQPSDARRRPLLIATGNAGKLREFRELLAGLPFEVVAQSELGIAAVDETGATFRENALLKAHHAARLSGTAAIADDSGLEVDVLHGAPGVYSARYAAGGGDAANNAKLVAALNALGAGPWTARYRCVLVFLAGPGDPAPLTAEGVWEGRIVAEPRGAGGFGYDPHFLVPELNLTAAELEPRDKNRLSHRGRALHALRAQLEARERAAARA